MSKSARFWDRTAKTLEGQVNEDDETAIITLDHTRKYLQSDDIVLDLACATGKYTFEVAPQVKQVWGIDFSTEMITAAKRNAVERSVANVQFMPAEITDPRLEGEFFNVILAYNILHLVEDPQPAVAGILEFLNVESDTGVDSFLSRIQDATAGSYHAKKQVRHYVENHSRRVGRYLENLSPDQIRQVEDICGDLLQELGYDT